MLDLRVELDHALMENSDFKSKGNSLFSEVIDNVLPVLILSCIQY